MLWLVLAWPALAQVVNYPGSASSGSSGPTNGLTQAQVSAAISSGTNTFNGAGIITNAQSATFASTGPFQRIFNITNYGADGSDGVIGQDQYAIQAAIDAANAAGGGIVYMPPGTYYVGPWTYHTNYTSENHPNCIDLTETANITLRGAGKDKSKVAIYPTASVPAIHNIFGAGDTVSVISNRFGATNLVFEDFTIDGAMNWGVATNQQFSFDSTQFYRNTGYPTTFRRMGWINIWEDAIDAQGMVIAIDCTATNIGNQFLGSGEPHIARNCIGWNIGCGLAPLNYYVALETLNPSQSYLTDCKFYGGGGRYHWTGSGVVRNCEFTWTNTPVYEFGFIIIDGPSANVNFENCIFNRTTGTPFVFTVLSNAVLTLSGNRFGQYCMALCSTNSRVNVTGNVISSDNGPTIFFDGSAYGHVADNQILGAPANPTILIQGTSTRRSDGLSIVNNDITGHLQFSDTARGTNIIIAHNTISDGSIRNYSGSVTNSFYDSNSYRSVAGGGGQMVFSMSPQIVRNNFGFQLYFTSDAGHWPDGDYFEGNVFSGPVSGISTGYIDNGNTNTIWVNNRFMTNYVTPFEPSYVTITANAALTKYHQRVIFNGSSLTCTLPSAVSVGRGWQVNVKNIHSTALTVATVFSQTVDGAAPTTMAQWVSRTFVSDGANWLTSDPASGSTTITNTTSAAGVVTGGSGSFGIGTNLTSVAGGTNSFFVAAAAANSWTNRIGDSWLLSGANSVLTVGTNTGNNTVITDGYGSFANGFWLDAGAQEYFVGKVNVGVNRGDFSLNSGTVSNLTSVGTITGSNVTALGTLTAAQMNVTDMYVTNAFFTQTNKYPILNENGKLVGVSKFTNSVTVMDGNGYPAAMTVGSGLSYDSGTKTLTATGGSSPSFDSYGANEVIVENFYGVPNTSFVYGQLGFGYVANSGASGQLDGEAGHNGIFYLSTSTSATAGPILGQFSAGKPFITSSGSYTQEWVLRLPTLPSADEGYEMRVGFGNQQTAAVPADAVYFVLNTNNTHCVLVTRNDTSESRATNDVVISANTWFTNRLVVIGDTSATLTVNGGTATTLSANLPSGSGDPTAIFAQIVKSNGTTARTLQIDSLKFGR